MSIRLPRRCRTAALALVLAGAAAFSPAFAAVPLGDQATYLTGVERLIASGDLATAEKALLGHRFDGEDNAFRAAFLLAMVKGRTGRLVEAEKLLRQMLAQRPNLERVQLELAHVLAAQGRREAAAYQLRRLADASGNDLARSELEGLIDRINPRGGWSANVFMTLAPSTNVNNGSRNTTILVGGLPFAIADDGRAQSGIGATSGVSLSYARPLSEKLTAFVAGSASFTNYSGGPYDKPLIELQAGLRHRGLKHFLSAELLVDKVWLGGDANSHGLGGRITGRWSVAPKWLLSADTTFMSRFADTPAGADANTWRSNTALRFSPSIAMSFWAGGGYETEEVRGRRFSSYRQWSGTLGHSRELSHGISVSAQLTLGSRGFEADFPGMGEPRRDEFYELRATVMKRDFQIFGVTPRFGISYLDQTSNVALYDFDRWSGDVTLTREF
ncbi:porin family protein [Hoeflea marina]|nr:porin family protein [Hoeflea marina]